MIGLSLARLDGSDLQEAADCFRHFQERYPLASCEIHTERSLFPTALTLGNDRSIAVCRKLRQSVAILGLHLPFMDLNPVSGNPRVVKMSLEVLEEAMDAGVDIEADFVVFHARGRHPSGDRLLEMSRWREVLTDLGQRAAARNLRFCLENADNLRRPSEVRELAEAAGIDICLDIGHLFERIYDDPTWTLARRAAARIQDIFSPRPFLLKSNLPAAETGGIDGLIGTLGKRIHCVHLHNHNGRHAHRPLSEGTVPWRRLAGHAGLTRDIPILLEADYRGRSSDCLERDLRLLTGLAREVGAQ